MRQPARRFLLFPATLPLLLLLAGCGTLDDDRFLLASLDAPARSRTLTAIGVEEYQVHLVRRAEYGMIDEVRRYFEVALRYDPANAVARKYLALVTNFRETSLTASLKEAARWSQKARRSEEESYQLFLAVQRAVNIDQSRPEVRKLVADTTSAQNAFVDASLARAKAATGKRDEKTPEAVREKLTIEAFQEVSRALAVDPQSMAAKDQKTILREEISAIVKGRLDTVGKLTAAQRFPEAKAQIAVLNDLTRKLDRSFDAEVRAASYTLNLRWAKALFDQKEYAQAEVKADAALALRRTEEAAALKKRIVASRAQAETAVSFDAALQEVDRLIARGELIAAQRKVDALTTAGAKSPAHLASLDDRGERIRANLEPLYEQAVEAYRAEDFTQTIELLETVVAIDESYEQATDYLDKAQAKQKLLEQF